ncbi:MAG: zinc ribbon domain-containing protein [Candidatus Nealsonbacteria bacterium]|nr:zinc ribbon domain-containing protein [Candidatus Nealsonbacteria bacterium]
MKKNYFYLLILTLLFLLFPLPTFAQWTFIRDALLFLPTLAIAAILAFVIFLSGGITWLVGAILNWVISPGFVSLSYTRIDGPNPNPIIGMGLNITQSFVNLALVVILVVIALSIALRLGEYGSKKIFAKLLIIALLVNFAPVLVGLIVDASNIVMNYFLNAITEGAMDIGSQVSDFSAGIAKVIGGAGGNIMSRLGLVMQGITQIIVNLSMAFAFLLFAALFLMRYVVIWTLTILSPLAFVAWILPGTKKLWNMWWNQLIQWSIIGIPIAFFLYLGLNSFSYLRSAFVSNLEMPGMEPATVGFLNEIFPFFVIIVFLILGFAIGLQTGAMGTKAVIKGFQAANKTAQKTTLKAIGRGTAAVGMAAGGAAAVSAVGKMQRTYTAGRAKGLSPIKATGEAVKRQWQRRTWPAIKQTGQVIKTTLTTKAGAKAGAKAGWSKGVAAGKGTWSAVKDIAKQTAIAGAVAGGIMKKKSPTHCPSCGGAAPAGASFCPHCGANF